jgi:hypothetical protein
LGLSIAAVLDMTLISVLSIFYVSGCIDIDHLGDPGIDGMIILRWIFRKWDVGLWTGSSWLGIGTSGGHL